MPRQLVRNTYRCNFCDADFPTEDLAKRHEEHDHDLVYIPIERRDLNGLLNFIVTNDNNHELLTDRLMTTLRKYTGIR